MRPGVGSFGGEHPKADCFFWWFVTRRCNNRCRHCLRLGIGDRGEFRPNRRGPALGHWPEDSFDKLMPLLDVSGGVPA